MEDWETYRISDFLLFSREVLYAIYESYNRAIWPIQIIWILASLALIALARRKDPLSAKIISGILAVAWVWISWFFHLRYFMQINWAAKYFAGLFFFEALLLLIFGVFQGSLRFGKRSWIGIGLLLFAIMAPAGLAMGQSPSQLLMFGWGPTHTAIGTIGVLLLAQGQRWKRVLLMLPAAVWCMVAALMYLGM